jgi:predicted translin family RNA/ssDNA-binding protein
MSENIEKSSSLNIIVEDIKRLKRRLESFERHVYNAKNEDIKKEYYRALARILDAEKALSHFEMVFNNRTA